MVQSWRKKRQTNRLAVFFFLAALGFWGKSLGGDSLCSTELAGGGVSGNTAVEWRQRLLDVMLMLGKDGQDAH